MWLRTGGDVDKFQVMEKIQWSEWRNANLSSGCLACFSIQTNKQTNKKKKKKKKRERREK